MIRYYMLFNDKHNTSNTYKQKISNMSNKLSSRHITCDNSDKASSIVGIYHILHHIRSLMAVMGTITMTSVMGVISINMYP